MDLEQVLTQMKSIPAPPQESGKGREILIVTHSNPKGLKMPIMKGGQGSVMFDVMDTMPKIQEGIDPREAIRTCLPPRCPSLAGLVQGFRVRGQAGFRLRGQR